MKLMMASRTAIAFAFVFIWQFTVQVQSVEARDPSAEEIRSLLNEKPSPVEALNDFCLSSRPPGVPVDKKVTVKEGKIYAQLLTPINSSFNRIGDTVKAVVTLPVVDGELNLLPEGSILEGEIESAKKNNFGQVDGAIVIKFHKAYVEGQAIDLTFSPQGDDKVLHPTPEQITKKARLRQLLMAGTCIAVPLAIGSGGTSLAITAGAGAVIGGVLADDGKYLQGALQGAWQGSGLSMFDPIVQKGRKVVLPAGTPLMLEVADKARIPKKLLNSEALVAKHKEALKTADRKVSILSTHAKIMGGGSAGGGAAGESSINRKDPLADFNRYFEQKNLAAAMQALDRAEIEDPENKKIVEMRAKVMRLVSGGEGNSFDE